MEYPSMGGILSTPKAPVIPPPAVMPTPDDAAVMAAKKKANVAARTRTGRQSTILTDYGVAGGNKLGG
jgi:hypothetical protein